MRTCGIILLALPLISACGGGGDAGEGEPDASSEITPERIVDLWKADRPAAIAAVKGAEDEVRQVALVQALGEVYTEQIGELCAELDESPARNRCQTIQGRPHLVEVEPGRKDHVPDFTGLTTLPDPFADAAAEDLPDCKGQMAECRIERAVVAIREQRPEDVPGICNGLEDERFRGECFFRSAELIALQPNYRGDDDLAHALQFCRATGSYGPRCVENLARILGRRAPPADAVAPARWDRLSTHLQNAHDVLAEEAPTVADHVVDRMWTDVIWASYHRAETITGNPLDTLPEAAHPHVRAAATWFAFEQASSEDPEDEGAAEETSQDRDLEGWVAHVSERLEARGEAEVEKTYPVRPTSPLGWNHLLDPEQWNDWVFFLGNVARPYSAESAEDLRICVVETAARRGVWSLVEAAAAGEGLAARDAERLVALHERFGDGERPDPGAEGPGAKGKKHPTGAPEGTAATKPPPGEFPTEEQGDSPKGPPPEGGAPTPPEPESPE